MTDKGKKLFEKCDENAWDSAWYNEEDSQALAAYIEELEKIAEMFYAAESEEFERQKENSR